MGNLCNKPKNHHIDKKTTESKSELNRPESIVKGVSFTKEDDTQNNKNNQTNKISNGTTSNAPGNANINNSAMENMPNKPNQNININIDVKIIKQGKRRSQWREDKPQAHEDNTYISKTESQKISSHTGENTQGKINPPRKSKVIIDSNVIVSKGLGSPFEYYNKDMKLGEGSFGTVHLVRHKILTSKLRAIKELRKPSRDIAKETEREIMNEINILKKLDHPNIVKLFEFYSTPSAYYLVTEFCREGELFKQIIKKAPFDEGFTAYIMYQILSAINYCHNMGIIHRDLKPENIMVESKECNGYFRVKVIDFGTAQVFEKGNIQKKVIGSSYYIAPEVLMKNYNEKCDMWSCGVIMYILLSSRPPFGGSDDQEIIKKIRIGTYDMIKPPFNKISSEAKSLISSLLNKDVGKRISAEEALNHPWFKSLKTKEKLNELKNNKFFFIQNLKNYRREKVLQSAALAYLVHNCSQNEEVVEAYKLFNSMDINGDGTVSQNELLIGLKQYLSLSDESLKDDVEIIFKNMDADENGYVECEEFVRAAINKENLITEDILKFAFNYFDKDGSGEITLQEIHEIFFSNTKLNLSEVQTQLQYIISEVDINGDGKICFDEFVQMMKSIIKED